MIARLGCPVCLSLFWSIREACTCGFDFVLGHPPVPIPDRVWCQTCEAWAVLHDDVYVCLTGHWWFPTAMDGSRLRSPVPPAPPTRPELAWQSKPPPPPLRRFDIGRFSVGHSTLDGGELPLMMSWHRSSVIDLVLDAPDGPDRRINKIVRSELGTRSGLKRPKGRTWGGQAGA